MVLLLGLAACAEAQRPSEAVGLSVEAKSDPAPLQEPAPAVANPSAQLAHTYGGRFEVSDALLGAAQGLPLGARYAMPGTNEAQAQTLQALGFARESEDAWRRDADLLAPEVLVPSLMPEFPEIDAIAVISTFRPQVKEQYLYETLIHLFAELPPSVQVNVLVGNGATDYVAPAVLSEKLGAAASRVHLITTPDEVDQFFSSQNAQVAVKATWNYARALRSYQGHRHLLLLEDDIHIAPHSLLEIRPLLQQGRTGVYALYNDRCGNVEGWWQAQGSSLTVGTSVIRQSDGFPTTQAIVYAANVANELGNYLMLRAGRESYDYMTGRYLAQFQYEIGYVYPSIVQHVGFSTTGLSGDHPPRTGCFLAQD